MAKSPLPAYDGDDPYIFLTYAHEDSALVYPQIRWLQDQGFNVWWDEGISPGAVWRRELAEAIRGCSLLLYFTTPNSVVSEHCTREVNFALDEHHRPVLAVHLEETALPGSLALSLSDRQAILQYALEPAEYERKLASTVAACLDQPVPEISSHLPSAARRRRSPWPLALVCSVLVGSVSALLTWNAMSPELPQPAQQTRFSIPLPDGVNLPVDTASHLAIDSTGEQIFFIGENANGRRQAYVRRLDQLASAPVPGTQDTPEVELESVTTSPDGRSLALGYNNGHVKRIAASGGRRPTFIADSRMIMVNRIDWGSHDRIAMRYEEGSALVETRPTGGELKTLATSDEMWQISFPRYSRDGKSLYFAGGENTEYRVMVTAMDGSSPITLIDNASDPRLTSSGHLLFLRDEAVWAALLEDGGHGLVGSPAIVLRDVTHTGIFNAQYAVSDNGTLVYQPATARSFDLVWVDRQGGQVIADTVGEQVFAPRVSPDGSKVAFTSGVQGKLLIYSLESGLLTQVERSETEIWIPSWSPDGTRIAYGEMASGVTDVFIVDLSKDEPPRRLTSGEQIQYPVEWTADGKYVLFDQCETNTGPCDIGLLSTDPVGRAEPMLDSVADERGPSLSPDNRHFAYTSNASGFDRIRARAFPDGERFVEAPLDGCHVVRWSPQGNELFGVCNGQMVAIPVRTDPSLSLGQPQVLFAIDPIYYRAYDAVWDWFFDVSFDGERFLMATERDPNSEIVVVLNWLDEVDRLVRRPDS